MNFNIFRAIKNVVQSKPGIRIPAPVEHRQTFHVPSPVRLRSAVKSLPVVSPRPAMETHEITMVVQNQRYNPGLAVRK